MFGFSKLLAKGVALITVVLALMPVALIGGAGPASAALGTSPYIDAVTSSTSCDTTRRRIDFRASIQLNSAYVPATGAYVSINFAFRQVDPAGRPTSIFYYSNSNGATFSTNPDAGWSAPALMKPSTTISPNYGFGGIVSSGGSTPFPGAGYAYWSNRVQTFINVRVWSGSQWIPTGWLTVPSYQSYFPDSTGGHWVTASECTLS